MSDEMRQPVQPVDEPKQSPQERQSALPTPLQFYEEFVAREDVRAILKRLADNQCAD